MKRVILWFFLTLILKQLLWMSFIPLWQFPDEQAHFAQVQNYAEGNPINPARAANTSREIDESEKYLGTKRDGFGNNRFTYHPEFNLQYTSSLEGVYEATIKSLPQSFRHETVSNEATVYPPLYYKLASGFYQLVSATDLITRVFFTRLINLGFYLLLVICVFLIGKILFPDNFLQQLTLAVLVGFHPMLSFLAGGVNSDNLFILLFTASILLGLHLLNYGWNRKNLVFIGLILLTAIWTKEMGKLVPLVFLYPLVWWSAKNRHQWRKIILFFVIGAGAFLLLFYRPLYNLLQGEQFLSEIPGLPSLLAAKRQSYLSHLIETAKHTYREVIPWYWGVFRWLSLTYPRLVHRIINWLLVVATAGVAAALLQKPKPTKNLWFLIYVSTMYFLAITTFDYLFKISHGFSLGVQGRYFFPTVVAHMALIQTGFHQIVSKFKLAHLFTKLLGFGMIVFHIYAFYFVTSSYFSWQLTTFFVQVSQYKPGFYKSPYLETFLGVYLLAQALFLVKYLKLYVAK